MAITPPAQLSGRAGSGAVPLPALFEQARGGPQGSVFALIVGINDYPGTQYDLGAAVADANTVNEALAELRGARPATGWCCATARPAGPAGGGGPGAGATGGSRLARSCSPTPATSASSTRHRGDRHRPTGGVLTDQRAGTPPRPVAGPPNMWLLLATCYAGGFTELLGPGRVLTAAAGANSLRLREPVAQRARTSSTTWCVRVAAGRPARPCRRRSPTPTPASRRATRAAGQSRSTARAAGFAWAPRPRRPQPPTADRAAGQPAARRRPPPRSRKARSASWSCCAAELRRRHSGSG